ncbi:3-deoxy-D-manno-octulosonic acid transferase [Edaphocola aurantiacus]|uniref:3-deoxy-D-manno-octulosonic acid transferase n=1 Tax=Edaphocola aurantiacus TaxID=2601682 RepID=UPI001C95E539|nr:glycosyltransferase N-terminal domain-containing protein [Edaphocola aurantiacus]
MFFLQLFLYNLSIQLYAAAAAVMALFQNKARLFVQGRKGLLSRIQKDMQAEQRKRIWMHCASLGEFEQGRPLLEQLRASYPNYCLVLTFFSPSGYEVRKNYNGADYIYYLPLDTPGNARKFVKAVAPQLAVFVKYEFWYHYLRQLHNQKIHTIIISTIFQQRHAFFKWYGQLHRKMLGYFDHLFVQTELSVQLLDTIGVHDCTLVGDTRLDRAMAIAAEQKDIEGIATFKGNDQLIVAGSTWAADEQLLAKTLGTLPEGTKLVMAPHEIDEVHIRQIQDLFGSQSCLYDQPERFASSRVLIVNRIGLLAYLYRYADYVWIGGGFNKTGIHNSIEAAVYGKALCWGPNYDRYQEALDLIDCQAAQSCTDAEELAAQLREWQDNTQKYTFASQASLTYVLKHKGATLRIMQYLATQNIF